MASAAKASLLCITHRPSEGNSHGVTVQLSGGTAASLELSCTFDFMMSEEERERLQWYLETYLEYPQEPAPALARQAERVLSDVGSRLFDAVFEHDPDARRLWARLEPILPGTRIEVASEWETGWPIPWELLRDASTGDCLAIRAREFVRRHLGPTRPVEIPEDVEPPIRILLVICRPGRDDDVPFRSVARKLVAALGQGDDFALDVLRPPTFEALATRLRAAKSAGKPYHVLHFDGHGVFLDVQKLFGQWRDKTAKEAQELLASLLDFDPRRFSPEVIYPGTVRPGGRGYLAFENPQSEYNLRLVDGPELGALLAETRVPILILNACRSARAAEPPDAEQANPAGKETDRHERVRAFGSFAQEVMDAGVPSVLAMRYNVYMVTAAEFVGNLYEALTRGETFGAAASAGRKHLKANPMRAISYDPVKLEDWVVPVVYEAAPIRLFSRPSNNGLRITVKGADATPGRGDQVNLPPPPDHGFFGRDETLLALDRAFDKHRIVLMWGYAGSGKTTAAAEFARWYGLTGGVEGPVFFTSFERYLPLPRVLDQIERVFGPALEKAGVHWLTADEAERRAIALQVLQRIPVLWIWNNVEPVAGFPAGTRSDWNEAEQAKLRDFLRDLKNQTRAKVLLTSRRDEAGWVGDLPIRIRIKPMPMLDRFALARALADRANKKLPNLAAWRPLLRFTQGNPLTVTVVVRQALHDGLESEQQIEDFLAKLRAGEAALEDEESEGRAKSLGASLSYGFEHAFSDVERRQLSLLHFFQGFISVDVWCWMGRPESDRCLPEVRGLTRAAGIALLDRAAEVGLLTALGGGYYTIHPALPWYFKSLFQDAYGEREVEATRAFVEAMGDLGDYCLRLYDSGNRSVVAVLGAEEANLLHARRLAHLHNWWELLIGTMQGLRSLCGRTGRQAEWQRLVDQIVPDFVDLATDGPVPGREELWGLVTDYRVDLARKSRRWVEARRLQRMRVEWDRQQAASALAASADTPDAAPWFAIRTLAVSVAGLGDIQREQGSADCVSSYEEAADLFHRISYQLGEAMCAFNLGHAYRSLPALHDLARAAHWYHRSLELHAEGDREGRSRCYNQLGAVAYERFREALTARQPEDELLRHLNAAARFCQQALDLLPSNAVYELADIYAHLGLIYGDAGDLGRALSHYREAIRYREAADDLHGAAGVRFNVALALANAGRLAEARAYAAAALRNYQTYSNRAAAEVERTQQLLAEIERLRQAQRD